MSSRAVGIAVWALRSDDHAAALFAARVYIASCLLLTAWFFLVVKLCNLNPARRVSDDADELKALRRQQGQSRAHVLNQLCSILFANTSRYISTLASNHDKCSAKKRSWILTGTAAFVSSCCSVPFLVDLISSGLDVAQVSERPNLSRATVMFFMAYLNMDLIIGSLYYRRNITLLTGWIHHSAYSILCIVVTRHRLTHVFAHAFIMESPTFLLALSMLVPRLRSDMAFNGLFFVTRIAWHAVLLALYWSTYGQTHAFGALVSERQGTASFTLIPAVGLSLAAPLHIQWFTSSVRGMLKRKRQTFVTPQVTNDLVTEPETAIPQPPSPLLLPQTRPRLVSLASSYLASPRPSLVRMRSALSTNPLALSMSYPTPLTMTPSTTMPRRVAIERQVKAFFDDNVRSNLPVRTQRWLNRSQHDILKAHAVYPITRLRMRAGRVLARGRQRFDDFAQPGVAT
ncbi:hypothetical protein OIV83_002053 [Microbotryomycetes sp. JL201]|nr:hypothetical protein OIV83_002053 [Microbotryomycetes sp. JL201]